MPSVTIEPATGNRQNFEVRKKKGAERVRFGPKYYQSGEASIIELFLL
jgi:hypothetical protein